MPEKVRSHEDLASLKEIVRNFWVFSGYSQRKIAEEFNKNEDYVKKYGTISQSSVAQYVKEARRDLENWLDEDALEKYTGEFVRKQFIMEEQIEKLRKAQGYIDFEQGEAKDKELYLKFEMAIHEIHKDQIKMMSEIELVLQIKRLAKDRRVKTETLNLIDDADKILETKKKRGYILESKEFISEKIEDSSCQLVQEPNVPTVEE